MAPSAIWNPSNPTKSLEEKQEERKNEISVEDSIPDYVRIIFVTDVNGRKRKLFIPAALDLERPKRPRTNFSSEQLKVLEVEFVANHFVSEGKRQLLAKVLGLTETQVKVWFQNRRTKLRRELPPNKPKITFAITPPFPFPEFSQFNENIRQFPLPPSTPAVKMNFFTSSAPNSKEISSLPFPLQLL